LVFKEQILRHEKATLLIYHSQDIMSTTFFELFFTSAATLINIPRYYLIVNGSYSKKYKVFS
ncbi:hypothetical protein CN481_15080, partial [Bacillus sp. AFS006103]